MNRPKIKIVTDATCHRTGVAAIGKSAGVAFFYDETGRQIRSEEFILGETFPYAAECETILRALDIASELTRGSVEVWTDSEILVRHMNGTYRLRSKYSKSYFDKLKQLQLRFDSVHFFHHSRATRLGKAAHSAAAAVYLRVHA